MKKLLLSGFFIATLFTNLSAQKSEIFIKNDLAIGGYDPVAYFTQNKPVKGNSQFAVVYKDAKWLFVSGQNADIFKAAPEKYAPQYGGYCAYGCSKGYKASTEADAWTIVNDKLYLNYDTDVRAIWNKDQPGYIKKADANWHRVKSSE